MRNKVALLLLWLVPASFGAQPEAPRLPPPEPPSRPPVVAVGAPRAAEPEPLGLRQAEVLAAPHGTSAGTVFENGRASVVEAPAVAASPEGALARKSEYHRRLTRGYVTYGGAAVVASYVATIALRHHHVHSFLLDHHSNLVHGVLFAGLFHNQATRWWPRLREPLLYATVAALAAANWLVELTPYTRYSPRHPDWWDFTFGMAGCVVYLLLARYLHRRYDRLPPR